MTTLTSLLLIAGAILIMFTMAGAALAFALDAILCSRSN